MRTAAQKEADELDADLYRVLIRVESQIDYARGKEKTAWRNVAMNLRSVRRVLRGHLMHTDDVSGTV